ncbi:hypothetical protein A1O1_04013 [Capronia coronata CBS 617.96]|uniref:Alcohol dehydrogenase n=1 Tax=Capronia coronata CBS 617.96 TaxID=1182541 RepID=W9YDH2_9EURO|nr:uncharacterized protein A1O1_04013 [Capronia coronata CBS 617.96]EXJ90907.1 hypothetical protein A1O1_04013 [Capronia coronata CBS 617.96]
MGTLLRFLHGQLSTPPMPAVDLTGRTILVTGANSGLGLDAAKLLVQLNCSTVILACRSLEKAEKAKEIVQAVPSANGQKPSVITMEVDMASFSSVVAFAQQCDSMPRLDAAVLNAGVDLTEFSLSEGYETTITVNVISTFLLATLMIPILRRSAQKHSISPVLAITGSVVHFWASPKDITRPAEGQILKTLSDKGKADMKARYYLSKLIVMLLVKHLASLLSHSAQQDPNGKPLVVVNNVAPGFCTTNLFRHENGFPNNLMLKAVGRPSEQGARTLVHAATAGKETHGQYLSECRVKSYSDYVKSAEGDRTANRLWSELCAIYEEVKPGCTKEL